MAVAITSPQSAVIARGKFTLAWTHTYPQAAYEVMYRRKGETAWSTFGRVTGTATSVTVDCSRFDDFVEYQYRVIVYSEYANTTETTYSGSDASAGYAFILVPDSMVGTMKVKYGDGMIEVPLYSTPQSGKQTISIGENKKTQLLNNDDSLSGSRSKVKVRTNNETRSLPRSDKYLSDPGEDRKINIIARSTYYTTYIIPAYYKYVPAYYKYTAAVYNRYYRYTNQYIDTYSDSEAGFSNHVHYYPSLFGTIYVSTIGGARFPSNYISLIVNDYTYVTSLYAYNGYAKWYTIGFRPPNYYYTMSNSMYCYGISWSNRGDTHAYNVPNYKGWDATYWYYTASAAYYAYTPAVYQYTAQKVYQPLLYRYQIV